MDTFKLLSRVLGFETSLYKYGDSAIDELEVKLQSGHRLDAVFTEFPGNPLLQSPNLDRLHALSRKYGFLLVVDGTVGAYANVNLLPLCDIICASHTKMFSGACNVMGGSVVVSPSSPFYADMRAALHVFHRPEQWFPEDVLVMEKNSRDYVERVHRASANAEAVAELLRRDPVVDEVYYPKGSPSQHIYDRYKLPNGGYGFLLSVRFTSSKKAEAFYDALDTAKGPSFGTNFTLTCKCIFNAS